MALQQADVKTIVDWAVNKGLDIPEFQREFVWDPQQVRFLVESLYREYPVGSFLLWDSSDYSETKGAEGAGTPKWIVDGQQRTTALCLVLGLKPYWWPDTASWNAQLDRYDVLANLVPDDDTVEFSLSNPVRRQDPRWYPVRQVMQVPEVEGLTALAAEIAARVGGTTPDPVLFGRIHGRLLRLWRISELDIPIVTVKHEAEDVAEIFARLNRAGTRVREADVVLALAAVRNPGWVREQYLPFTQGARDKGWDLDAGVYVRTLTGIGVKRARLREVPHTFWSPEGMLGGGAWKKTQEAINSVLKRLADKGLQSDDLLPSSNSLIPVFVFHDRWSKHHDYDFDQLFRWFLLANRDGRYGGSATTALNEDVQDLTGARSPGQALSRLHGRLRIEAEVSPDDFLLRYDRAGNRFLRLMVYLTAYAAGAKDWVDKTVIGYDKSGSPIADGYAPQWHHIFPKKVLEQERVPGDQVNALANITVLNEATNLKRLSAKPPAKYIKELRIDSKALARHQIPATFANAAPAPAKAWAVGRYEKFIAARAKTLADHTNRYLDRLAK